MKDSKTVVGIDIAKRVFQLRWVDMETGEIVSLQLKREKFLEHFAARQPCLIGCLGVQCCIEQTRKGGFASDVDVPLPYSACSDAALCASMNLARIGPQITSRARRRLLVGITMVVRRDR